MQDRFKFRVWNKLSNTMTYNFMFGNFMQKSLEDYEKKDWVGLNYEPDYICFNNKGIEDNLVIMQCTGLKDKNGKLIYEGDIIVIPNQYPFYDYKNNKDMKQNLYATQGKIIGESVLNYIGVVENIYNCWQYVYRCVNSNKRGISEGVNNILNDYGFSKDENSYFEVIGNIYENPELLEKQDD